MRVNNTYDAIKVYGPITGSIWMDEAKHMMMYSPPTGLKWINSFTKNPVTKIYCNMDMAKPLDTALNLLISRGQSGELKTFDGCFMIRDVRGRPGFRSAHSYGLAIDVNASENPLGGPVALTLAFRQCFKDAGFDCGADFTRVDGMHMSFCWEH
jgi:hypothetical protein